MPTTKAEVETGVYMIRNTVTGQRYIGSTRQRFAVREKAHWSALANQNHRNAHLQAAWDKYGAEAFEFIPVELVADVEQVALREQWWLDVCWDEGLYNIARNVEASMLGRQMSQTARRKISEAQKGKVLSEAHRQKLKVAAQNRSEEARQHMREAALRRSPETHQRIAASLRGRMLPLATMQKLWEGNRGSRRSAETRQKISAALSSPSEETKRKRREAATGRVLSEEARRKIGDAHRGKVHSAETKEKMRLAHLRHQEQKRQRRTPGFGGIIEGTFHEVKGSDDGDD